MGEAQSKSRSHSAESVAEASPLQTATIPFSWVIPSFKELLTCQSPLFDHESLPGISWQFFFETKADSPQLVRICLASLMSRNKSGATAVSASASVQLASSDGTGSPITHEQPMVLFQKNKYSSVRMAEMCKVKKLSINVGSLILSGEITAKLPPGSAALRQTYESGEFSDLDISAERATFKVHKAILAATCPAILNLLHGQKVSSIRIGSTASAIRAVLQYLYDDPLSFSGLENLSSEVMVLAENFKLLPLKQMCEAALVDQLRTTNVFKIVGLATDANSDVLKQKACQFAVSNTNSLVLDNGWQSLKTDHPTAAMSFCEYVVTALSQRETGQVELIEQDNLPDTAISVSNSPPLEIPVVWEISDFQNLMENSECGFSITCKEKFSHESMPGIAWELILYPNGKEDFSHHVALFMRPILTSNKKSQATTPSAGYLLRWINANVAADRLPQQILPIQQFSLKSELGIAQFAHQRLVEKHCLAKDGSVILAGKILLQPPAIMQSLFLRRSYESGSRSDFTVKINDESVAVHKLILSEASPTMSGMFDMDCEESRNNLLVIKDTTVEAGRALLQFWYGDPLCFDGLEELSMNVYKLANRYQDFKLRQICEDALLRMASPENVVHLAAFAADQNCGSLAKMTAKIICENPVVLGQGAWTQLKDENFNLALSIMEEVIFKNVAGRCVK